MVCAHSIAKSEPIAGYMHTAAVVVIATKNDQQMKSTNQIFRIKQGKKCNHPH